LASGALFRLVATAAPGGTLSPSPAPSGSTLPKPTRRAAHPAVAGRDRPVRGPRRRPHSHRRRSRRSLFGDSSPAPPPRPPPTSPDLPELTCGLGRGG
jgi:hypothetical protein